MLFRIVLGFVQGFCLCLGVNLGSFMVDLALAQGAFRVYLG